MSEPQEKLDISDLKDTFLECPVCVEHFNQTDRRPRLLHSCLHAFCTQCLQQLLDKEGKGQITCPLCRQVQKVKGKADTLPADPVRGKLVEYVQIKHKQQVLCGECEEHDAVSRCQECQTYLCKECDFVHKRHRVSKGHPIVSLEEVLQQPVKNISKGHFCPRHCQHHLEFYCATDEQLCCVSCTVLDHKGHDLLKLDEAAATRKQELETRMKELYKLADHLKEARKEANQQENCIADTKAKSLSDIDDMFGNLKKVLDTRKRELVAAVHEKSTSLLSTVQKTSASHEQTLAIIESTATYFTQAKGKADVVEMLQMYPAIKRSVDGLKEPKPTSVFAAVVSDFTFVKKMMKEMEVLVNTLGGFSQSDKDKEVGLKKKILAWRGEVYHLLLGKDDEWRQKFDRTKLQDIVSSYEEAGQFYLIGDMRDISIAYKELTQEYDDDALQPAAKLASRLKRKLAASTTVTVGRQKSVDDNDPDQKTVKGKLLTVKVYKQDITKLPVDVVVNAANENLSHGGGVARIIAKVAGNKLIEESNEIVRNSAIPVSHLAVTAGGSLPCRRVFHAVGPRWHDYGSKNKCLEDLSNTILRCLCEARNRGYSSIAFPSISAAIFAVPEELCGKMYVQALKSFDHVVEGGSLKEVHFVDITDKMVDIIQKELERNWDLPQDTETLRKDTAFINRNLGSSEAFALTSHDGQYKQTTKPATSTLADAFFNFSENISISIFYQDIFSTKTEVFVSWEDICLLSRKPLVTALKKQAGDQYRADRNKHYSAKLGDIIETPGWKLNQSRIIHAVVGSSAKEEDFNVTLRNVLGQCVKMNCSSVLLPVYNHIYSSVQGKNKSALFIEIVVDALSDLSRHKNKPSLCVYVVDKQQSVITELCRVFHKYLVSAGHTQVMTTQVDKTKEPQKEADGNGCSICLDSITQPSRLKCGHVFCKGCIDDAFKVKKACPVCKVVCGMITGNMPPGDMSDYLEHSSLPGHSGTATIVITYSFKDGIQTSEHPHPGKKYLGTNRTAYLPDTPEGRKVLDLLKEAWYRRLTFTVGQSVTIGGHYDRVTWNEIHHKTSKSGGSTKHGYPDHGYLKRVQEELAAQGVVEAKDMDTSL